MDRTEILVLLDESGSMGPIRADTIGGFNTFLQDQQNQPGDARLSLVKFSSMDWGSAGGYYRPVCLSTPIGACRPLTKGGFIPRGNTPLLDAMAKAIDELGSRLANTPEAERPGKVIFVTITDGHENASRYCSREQVMERVQRQQARYGWQFVYLGANQDAIAVAADLGIGPQAAMSYDVGNTAATFEAMGAYVTRSRGATGQATFSSNSFSDAERAQAAAGVIVSTTGANALPLTIVVDTNTSAKP